MKTSIFAFTLMLSFNTFASQNENVHSIKKEEVIAALAESQAQQTTLTDIAFVKPTFTLDEHIAIAATKVKTTKRNTQEMKGE